MRPVLSMLAAATLLASPAVMAQTTIIQTPPNPPAVAAPPSGSVTMETRRQTDEYCDRTVSKSTTYQSEDGTVSRSRTVTRSDDGPGGSTTTTTTTRSVP